MLLYAAVCCCMLLYGGNDERRLLYGGNDERRLPLPSARRAAAWRAVARQRKKARTLPFLPTKNFAVRGPAPRVGLVFVGSVVNDCASHGTLLAHLTPVQANDSFIPYMLKYKRAQTYCSYVDVSPCYVMPCA